MTFTISAPPHRKDEITFKKINWSKMAALLPVILISIYFFGIPALGIILAGVLSAIVFEVAIQKVFNQKISIADGHAIMIGLMVALIVPPEVPIWIPMAGSLFAIAIGKHIFGGIGSYVFNPVLAAWVFLNLAWGSIMTPVSFPQLGAISNLVLENGAGLLIGVSPIALLGGLVLIYLKYVEWRIPLSYFMTTMVLALLVGDNLSHVITGAFLFGVLFIATDMATSPVTKNGRVVYGILCGILTVIYGHFDNYVYAAFYGVFLANCVSSFIENVTLPRPFGTESYLQNKYRSIMKKIPFEKLGVSIDE
ncbi:MAG: RnfABCDGE type electron transport complex subunit D [Methanosarcinaceae archaeon]|nr:RnfABCDGE type electron transport complex subunit D [Methanosarcinaceae archaeon]